jgi:hypothetical protein
MKTEIETNFNIPASPTTSDELDHVAREWRRRSHLGIPIPRELSEAYGEYRRLTEAERPRPVLVPQKRGAERQALLDAISEAQQAKVKRSLGQW